MALNPEEGESRGFKTVKSLSQGQQESALGSSLCKRGWEEGG